jgi:hypothetical protein
VADELRFHLEQIASEYRAAGASPEEAERLARERFGDYASYEETCLRIGEETAAMQRRRSVLDTLWQDADVSAGIPGTQRTAAVVRRADGLGIEPLQPGR